MSSNLPALLGGTAVRPAGPPSWPRADPEVRLALEQAFVEGSWGSYHGPNVPLLEDRLRAFHAIPHVLLCGSGSFAIEIALRAVPLQPGDEVILAAYDFPGNFLSIHAVGAMPVLADLDPLNWNLSLDEVAHAITPQTRAMLVSHLHGGVVPMRELMSLARERNIVVIEDACQCPGAVIQGRRAGTWGDVGVLSFGGSKLLSAGRGGALLTARDDLYHRVRTHQMRGNLLCPLSELQAAVLIPQFERLEERNRTRREQVQRLEQRLVSLPGLRMFKNSLECPDAGFYKVGVQYDAERFGLPRRTLVAAARAEGVALSEGFAAAHVGRSPRRFRGGKLTEADRANSGCVVLHHPVLLESEEAMDEIALALHKIHRHARDLADWTAPASERSETP